MCERGREGKRWILAVSAAAAFMAFLDATIVTIAFPKLQAAFSETSRAELAWVLAAYSTVFVGLLVPAGRYSDVFGARRLFLIGVAGFIVTSAACAAAWSPGVLIAARVLQATAGAVLIPASLAVLLAAFPPERHATAIGLWGAAAAIAAALGPPLGGLLTSAGSWRWIFLVNPPFGVAVLLFGRRVLPRAPGPGGRLPDVLGSVLIALAVAGIALGLVQVRTWGWDDARTWIAIGAGAGLLPLFVARCRAREVPAVDLALFRVRDFTLANAGTCLFALGLYGVLLANVLFLTGTWHYSILRTGLATMPAPIVAAVVAGFSGKIVDRGGLRAVIVVGGGRSRRATCGSLHSHRTSRTSPPSGSPAPSCSGSGSAWPPRPSRPLRSAPCRRAGSPRAAVSTR